ncbi:MAG: hypothetical protein V1647_06455 [Pseudomonadota bacterium]
MKQLSVTIFDSDAIRAEAVRETLAEGNYVADIHTSDVDALKSVIEKKPNVIFLSSDFTSDIKEFVSRIKNYDNRANIICMLSGTDVETQAEMSELGVKYYIETPLVSTKDILDKIEAVEAEIINEDERNSFFISMLTSLKKIASMDNKLKRKLNIALNMFTTSEDSSGKIKGTLKDVPYFEAVRIAAGVHSEGVLEFVNNEDRAVFVIKNKNVVSAYVTPGVRGLKAFLRVAGWEDGSFNFRHKINVSYSVESEIANMDITRLCSMARRAFEWSLRMRNNLPPKDINLKINISSLKQKQDLNQVEFDVLTTVVEKSAIKDILNYNNNTDVDIMDSMISLRKKGIIEVCVQ